MPSFSIPLTGLEADSTALNTIANNLANLNTTAYKSQSTTFSDLFYQQIGSSGSGDPLQVGAGTKIASISGDFTQGSTNTTSNSTDVLIQGNGFFVLQNGGNTDYTRAGNFTLSSTGYLTTQDGQKVMGYPASATGVVNTNAPLAPIQIPVGEVEQPRGTSSMSLTANLDATAAVPTTVPAQITLYDSLGVSHVATVTFTKAAAGSWDYSIALPSGDAATNVNTTGTLNFDANGNLTTPLANVAGIGFTGLADGAKDLSFTWDLYGSNQKPSITQVASASSITSTTQDGFASGQYESFNVGSDGLVTAKFDNGQTSSIGQLAIATVDNLQGMSRVGSNNYETTLASGVATVGIAGTSGRGTLTDGALEDSNVDIATQFSALIVAQRAFEANSKAITTFDTVTQETINMIH